MKTLTIHLGSSENTDGYVKYEKRPNRSPRQYYGLAVAAMNRTFDWGAPWKVTRHEDTEPATQHP